MERFLLFFFVMIPGLLQCVIKWKYFFSTRTIKAYTDSEISEILYNGSCNIISQTYTLWSHCKKKYINTLHFPTSFTLLKFYSSPLTYFKMSQLQSNSSTILRESLLLCINNQDMYNSFLFFKDLILLYLYFSANFSYSRLYIWWKFNRL